MKIEELLSHVIVDEDLKDKIIDKTWIDDLDDDYDAVEILCKLIECDNDQDKISELLGIDYKVIVDGDQYRDCGDTIERYVFTVNSHLFMINRWYGSYGDSEDINPSLIKPAKKTTKVVEVYEYDD